MIMAYQIALFPITFCDLQGHLHILSFLNAISSRVVLQLTVTVPTVECS